MVKFRVCADGFRRWGSTMRVYVVAALTVLMIFEWVRKPILVFSNDVGVPVSPWIFPFLMEDWYLLMIVQLAVVLLFCDVPFLNEGTSYLLLRCGRRDWFWGQVLYILLAALAYQVFLFAVCALAMAPNLEWTMKWGKVLGTLAQTNADAVYETLRIPYVIMTLYTPLEATLLALALGWMVMSVIGALMLFISLCLPRVWGPVAGCGISALAVYAMNFSGPGLYYFSPGSWMRLSQISQMGMGFLPTLPYVFTAGFGLLAAFTLLARRLFTRFPINGRPDYA